MIDPNFDPYQELIDLSIEIQVIRSNQMAFIDSHNRMNKLIANQQRELLKQLKFIQQQQALIAELSHKVDLLTEK